MSISVRASAHKKPPLKEHHQQEEKVQQDRIVESGYKHNDANCKNGGYDDHERSWYAVVTQNETTPLRHFQKTSTFVIGLSILIYDSDTDFIRINNQFTCIGTGWLAGRKETDWIRVGISALNPDHTADWPYHYTFV